MPITDVNSDDLSANINIRFCANCGNIISGGKINRIYCNQEENIECFRQRNANRQKKSYRKNTTQTDILFGSVFRKRSLGISVKDKRPTLGFNSILLIFFSSAIV